PQARKIRRRIRLHTARQCLLHLLQEDDVSIVAADFGNRQVEIDRSRVWGRLIPVLAELNVELQDSKRAHAGEVLQSIKGQYKWKHPGWQRARGEATQGGLG